MTIYISVVSHGHSDLIKEIGCLKSLVCDFQVIVKSNKANDDFLELSSHPSFHWIDEEYFCGFGHNNNIVFNYCYSELGMASNDYFIVLNPDVSINSSQVKELVEKMKTKELKLSAINLYKDKRFSEYDNSIRKFPTLIQFVRSFLGFGNNTVIDKSRLVGVSNVDWAAGSFLAFKSSHYESLQGFDENYFMYCEDIDICYRSHKLGVPVSYHSEIRAVHLARHANRNVLSKHFIWHMSSVFRFIFSKFSLTTLKSSINT